MSVQQSIDPILDLARREHEAQQPHFDSLDSKAGILLGFSGALIALAPVGAPLLVDLGRGVAALAAGLALSTFWPRRYQILNLRILRDRYLAAEPAFTLRRILDTHISMFESNLRVLETKSHRLKLAMVALALAASFITLGLVVA